MTDFTRNMYKGLFFAIDKHIVSSDNVIDQYVSLYAVKQGQEDLSNLRDVLENAFNRLEEYDDDPAIDCASVDQIRNSLETYAQAISWDTMISLDDGTETNPKYILGINSNQNIRAQEGLFILNPSDKDPLDEQFDGFTINNFVGSRANRLFYGKMECWDIKKEFIPIIEDKLRELNIKEDTVYPDKADYAKNVYKEIMA